MKNLEETIFFIIAHSGEAKSCIMEAIELAKNNDKYIILITAYSCSKSIS